MQETLATKAAGQDLLTVPEAAAEARVSKPHLYRLVAAGEVPAIRVGDGHGPLRVLAEPFRDWLYGDQRERA